MYVPDWPDPYPPPLRRVRRRMIAGRRVPERPRPDPYEVDNPLGTHARSDGADVMLWLCPRCPAWGRLGPVQMIRHMTRRHVSQLARHSTSRVVPPEPPPPPRRRWRSVVPLYLSAEWVTWKGDGRAPYG